jgi:hypothetical protein
MSTFNNNGNTVTPDVLALMAQIAELQKQNEALAKDKANKKSSIKVSEKGAVSVYGIHTRFPVTLYRNQWERLLGMADQIKAFIEANEALLAKKE